MVTKTTRARNNGRKNKTQDASRNRMISLEEIESFGATEIKRAFVPELKGYVLYKDTKAKGVIRFFEAEDKAEQLRAMANFIACSFCTEDGAGIYRDENHVLESLTPPSIEAISLGIARARQEENEALGND